MMHHRLAVRFETLRSLWLQAIWSGNGSKALLQSNGVAPAPLASVVVRTGQWMIYMTMRFNEALKLKQPALS